MRKLKYEHFLAILFLIIIVLFDSCLNDETEALRPPTITIISNNLEVRQGSSVILTFKIDAPEGLKQVTIDGVSISLDLIELGRQIEYEYSVTFNHPVGQKLIEVQLVDLKQQTAQEIITLGIIEYPEIKFYPKEGVWGDTLMVSQSEVNLSNAKVFFEDSLAQTIDIKNNQLYVRVPYFIKEQEFRVKLVIESTELFAKEKFKVLDPIERAIDGIAVLQTKDENIPVVMAHQSGSVFHFFGDRDLTNITGLLVQNNSETVFAKFEEGRISNVYTSDGLIFIRNYRKDTIDVAFINKIGETEIVRNYVIPGLETRLRELNDGRTADVSPIGKKISNILFTYDALMCGAGILSIPTGLGGIAAGLGIIASCGSAMNTMAERLRLQTNETLESSGVAFASGLIGLDLDYPECLKSKAACVESIVVGGLTIADTLLDLSDETTTSASKTEATLSTPCSISVSSAIDSKGTTITILANKGTPPYTYSLNNSPFQSSGIFLNQKEGFHFYSVKDKNNCFKAGEATLAVKNDCEGVVITFDAVMDKDNVIKISNVVGGIEPYEYSVANSPFQLVPIFDNAYKEGSYKIEVKDAKGCTGVKIVNLKPESSLKLPTITTAAITNGTSTSLTSGGEVTNDGGSPVVARGVIWNTSSDPTITLATKTTNGTGTGVFTSSINSLQPNTKYYIRAYATNAMGTAYGNEVVFTTTALSLVTIVTSPISSITTSSATSGGTITNDGGSTIIAKGIVWSISAQPTIVLTTKTTNGTGSASFTSSMINLQTNTKYFVRAYATNSIGTAYGNEVEFTTASQSLPTITTNPITSITTNAALGGGEITSDGGTPILVRGVVWNTSPQPNVGLSTKTTNGAGIGMFSSSITNLQSNVQYYVRAYATNSNGTAYGNEIVFTTSTSQPIVSSMDDPRDGQSYKVVQIGSQYWFAENLRYTPPNVPQVTGQTEWAAIHNNGNPTGQPAWCWQNNNSANDAIYGKLYNWFALNATSICPPGWHVPTDAEWTVLTDYLGSNAGGKMKSTSFWIQPNTGATNESGFSALPGGSRGYGGFSSTGAAGQWWSSTVDDKVSDQPVNLGRILSYNKSQVERLYFSQSGGMSCRCIKD